MKALRIRLIRGLIAVAVIAADEQALHLDGMNKADNPGVGALMGKPRLGGLASARCEVPLGLRRWFTMDVAFHNHRAVVDTNERRQVARIPAGQPSRAMVYPACAARWARGESRAVRKPGGDSSDGAERRRGESGTLVVRAIDGPIGGEVSGLTAETCPRYWQSVVIAGLVSGFESLFVTRF